MTRNNAILAGAALGIALAPLAQAQADGPVVINEFLYDNSGTDSIEFVELYNATANAIDIGDWLLEGFDSGGADTSIPIPTGTMLASGDFYVIGMTAVPNVDLDKQLLGFADWQNGPDGLRLVDNSGRVIDTLVYQTNKSGAMFGGREGDDSIWANHSSRLPATGVVTICAARLRDGYDSGINGLDFRMQPWTPGTSNNNPGDNYWDDFDSATPGDPAPRWSATWVNPTVIDPAIVGPAATNPENPSVIPASPDGGNACVFWDPGGGGNFNPLAIDASASIVFEAYVYMESTLLVATEYEWWSVGIGATGNLANSPDPSGNLGFTANGHTGVTWTFQRFARGFDTAAIYLVDHNDGGWANSANVVSPANTLATIPIVPGSDGWQRLRLQIHDGMVTGHFGGTYGKLDGIQIGPIPLSMPFEGNFWAGYRESIVDNTLARPLTMDRIRVTACDAASAVISASCPPGYHSGNGPVLSFGTAPNDLPRLGGAIDIVGSNLLGGSMCGLLMGAETSPVALAPIGGLPGASLCIAPEYASAACSGAATTTVTLPIVADLTVCGTVISFQWFDFDQSQAGTFPIAYGTSEVGTVKVGL